MFTAVSTLCGGLAFFLYGMLTVSEHLERLMGERTERLLRAWTGSPGRGAVFGAAATAALQSSSALTVVLVGLADAGVLGPEAVGAVIAGANVGTTLTPWLMALPGGGPVPSPEALAPVLALLGVVWILGRSRCQEAGRVLVGFAVLFSGMELMRRALLPLGGLSRLPAFFASPLRGLLAGAVLTAVIQSSAASMGMLQALCQAAPVSYGAALPVILGLNIGTCATALLSALGAGRAGRRVAAVHVAFNVSGSALWLLALSARKFLPLGSLPDRPATPAGMALLHTLFNLSTAALWLFVLRRRYKTGPRRAYSGKDRAGLAL